MKEFKITEEQIKELAKGNSKVKKWFPEVFETKLEVGKWYTPLNSYERKCVFFALNNTNFYNIGYGINYTGNWTKNFDIDGTKLNEIRLATEEEVFEALKNEAVKRGFKEGAYFKNISTGNIFPINGYDFKIGYGGRNNMYENNGQGLIFEDGVWAEIIPTLTKEEAEKKLNVKIID